MSTHGTLCEMPVAGQYFLIEALDIASTKTVKDWDNALVTFLPNEIILTTLDPVNEDKVPVRQVYHHPAGDPPHYTFITESDIPLVFIPSSFDMPKLAIFENKSLTEGIVLTLHKSDMGKLAEALVDNPEILEGLLPSHKELAFCSYPWNLLSFDETPMVSEYLEILDQNSLKYEHYTIGNLDSIRFEVFVDPLTPNGDHIYLKVKTEANSGKISRQTFEQMHRTGFVEDIYDRLSIHKHYVRHLNPRGKEYFAHTLSNRSVMIAVIPEDYTGKETTKLYIGY